MAVVLFLFSFKTGSCYVAQAWPRILHLPPSASRVLELQAYATPPGCFVVLRVKS
jgi:hypothetical protein